MVAARHGQRCRHGRLPHGEVGRRLTTPAAMGLPLLLGGTLSPTIVESREGVAVVLACDLGDVARGARTRILGANAFCVSDARLPTRVELLPQGPILRFDRRRAHDCARERTVGVGAVYEMRLGLM